MTPPSKKRTPAVIKKHLERLRRMCLEFPEASERLSHGEPTFFARKRVFAMFDNDHHSDGHLAVWIPAPTGLQEMLIEARPETYFRPAYVGGLGWVGIELDRIDDATLAGHLREAWTLVAPKKLVAAFEESARRLARRNRP